MQVSVLLPAYQQLPNATREATSFDATSDELTVEYPGETICDASGCSIAIRPLRFVIEAFCCDDGVDKFPSIIAKVYTRRNTKRAYCKSRHRSWELESVATWTYDQSTGKLYLQYECNDQFNYTLAEFRLILQNTLNYAQIGGVSGSLADSKVYTLASCAECGPCQTDRNGECVCPPGATLNADGECECIDSEHYYFDEDSCTCKPRKNNPPFDDPVIDSAPFPTGVWAFQTKTTSYTEECPDFTSGPTTVISPVYITTLNVGTGRLYARKIDDNPAGDYSNPQGTFINGSEAYEFYNTPNFASSSVLCKRNNVGGCDASARYGYQMQYTAYTNECAPGLYGYSNTQVRLMIVDPNTSALKKDLGWFSLDAPKVNRPPRDPKPPEPCYLTTNYVVFSIKIGTLRFGKLEIPAVPLCESYTPSNIIEQAALWMAQYHPEIQISNVIGIKTTKGEECDCPTDDNPIGD